MIPPLVSTAWLAERLGQGAVQVVDATWFMPGEEGSGAASYAEAHIPGAVFFDIDEIADPETDLPHMLPRPQAFAEAAGRLGLTREGPVVVYDARGIFSAPRVWWTLRVMGFPEVAVLDGGLPAWRAERRPLQSAAASPTRVKLAPKFVPELVRDLDEVRRILDGRAAQVVDARPAARFQGDAPEPRPGLRAGHMPGALSLPWSSVVGPEGRMRPEPELRAAFEAAGIDLAAPIVTTCGSGVTAATDALALAMLGRADVAIYDGSWSEWGRRSDTPVSTGAA